MGEGRSPYGRKGTRFAVLCPYSGEEILVERAKGESSGLIINVAGRIIVQEQRTSGAG